MPTVRRCCIIGCNSNSRERPQLQFFQFPKPEHPYHKLWTQACQASLSRILPFKKPVVCALHFHPKNIGGRRLTGSAIPCMYLDVPSNLRVVEQQAMAAEIERSRKCAFINAVVYEWLVRANLNANLRGSITHGMIKDKAEGAKNMIGLDTFVSDNRWLNRFRETHLTGFAAKLAANQLTPQGNSLWIPDIVKDLEHLYPPANVDHIENVPEQYFSYMKQYGEYDEEDDKERDYARSRFNNTTNETNHNKRSDNSNFYNNNSNGSYQNMDSNNSNYSGQYITPNFMYDGHSDSNYSSPHNSLTSQSPPTNTNLSLAKSQKAEIKEITNYNTTNFANEPTCVDDDDVQIITECKSVVTDLNTNEPDIYINNEHNNHNIDQSNLSSIIPQIISNESTSSKNIPPTLESGGADINTICDNGTVEFNCQTLMNYEEALKYIKPLEDFVLVNENFRAIGLLSQLEIIFRRGVAATSNTCATVDQKSQ